MWDWIAKLDELSRARRRFALVTVTAAAGSTPTRLGAKMIVLDDGGFFGTIGGGHLEQLALGDARECAVAGQSRAFKYTLGASAGQCCGGVVETFVEAVGVEPLLYVFGAGHIAQALCRVLEGTAFRVSVADEREDWVARLPESVARAGAWDEVVDGGTWDASRTYVAIMTHRHDLDQEIVASVVRKPAKYIGLVGSRTKWAKFEARLGARGFTREELSRVRCPMGLHIGGKAPAEVAVSIAAEILKIHHAK